MSKESKVAYQRNRLRTVDTALISLTSIFSFLLAGASLILDKTNVVALLPLLIPVLMFPLIDGVIIGIIIKDSLKWRARGWLHLFIGSAAIPGVFLIYYTWKTNITPYDMQISYLLAIGLVAAVAFVNRRVTNFYSENFKLIRVVHDIDEGLNRDVFWTFYIIASGAVLWSLQLLKIISTTPVYVFILFLGIYYWVLDSLDVKKQFSSRTRRILYIIYFPLEIIIYILMLMAYS